MNIFENFWQDELSDLNLPDARLNKRIVSLLCCMNSNPGSSINSICTDKKESKAAYRVLDNDSFSSDEVMHLHYEKTIERCEAFENVILIQDTTGFNYSQSSKQGMGRIGGKIGRQKTEYQGLFCHNLIAFSAAGEPLGLFDQQIWARKGKSTQKGQHYKIPIRKKESYKWIKSLDKEEYLHGVNTKFTVISDRESDVSAYLGSTIDRGMDFVIRINGKRTDETSNLAIVNLFKEINSSAEINLNIEQRTLIETLRRKPQKVKSSLRAKETRFSIKFCKISVRLKNSLEEEMLQDVYGVQIKEKMSKKGLKPIEWNLMTTRRVTSLNEAQEIIKLYQSRWRIEVYHKAQKSSCKIEKINLRHAKRVQKFIALQSLVAFGICRLKYLLEAVPEEPAENYFEKELIDILVGLPGEKVKNKQALVKDFIFKLANLEGYKTYNLKTPPGVIVLGKALNRFNSILYGYAYARKSILVGKR